MQIPRIMPKNEGEIVNLIMRQALVKLFWFSLFGLVSWEGMAQATGHRLEFTQTTSGRVRVFEEGSTIYFVHPEAPRRWQKGTLREVHPTHLVIAEGGGRGFPRQYALTEVQAMWPRHPWFDALKVIMLGAAATPMVVGYQQYVQTPTLGALTTLIIGASGMVLSLIPILIFPDFPSAQGWEVVVLPPLAISQE